MIRLRTIREKNLGNWLGGYLRQRLTAGLRPRHSGLRHLLFALCDHFEPGWGDAAPEVAEARVRSWQELYPRLADSFRDADGHRPRHTFFFPAEQYAPSLIDRLTTLVRAGLGEMELHLHHDNDTPEGLRESLLGFVDRLAAHGHLSTDRHGRRRYAFIHGNWCLANARKDGRYCGVEAELPLLFETGCYADFTFPSAPDETQPGTVNQIYWPSGDLSRRRAYEGGQPARVGLVRDDRLLIIQGPLGLALRRGPSPVRIENGHLTGRDPATPSRVRTWVAQGIQVLGRPDWIFVKVHTHGAPESTAGSLLGEGGRQLHEALAAGYNDGRRWALHYLTAREMYNVAMAAMDRRTGSPAAYRDYLLAPPRASQS